jgi:hypothetical protein
VPAVVPHQDGRLLWAAVQNVIMPRVFFPQKGEITSTSDLVRTYAGVWVSGREVGTSFAFGYAIESYVDFGLPFMFVPIFFFGFVIGSLHQLLLRRVWNNELAVAVACVLMWRSLYLFEESWTMKIGSTIIAVVVLTGTAWVLAKLVQRSAPRRSAHMAARWGASRSMGDVR